MLGHETYRHGFEVFDSESQFQREGDYVTNLLVLDPENSGGTNYAVEVWDDKPHQVASMSEIALTVVGVLNKSGGVPALRAIMAAQPPKPAGVEAPSAETAVAA